jgi:hypothetical protein
MAVGVNRGKLSCYLQTWIPAIVLLVVKTLDSFGLFVGPPRLVQLSLKPARLKANFKAQIPLRISTVWYSLNSSGQNKLE